MAKTKNQEPRTKNQEQDQARQYKKLTRQDKTRYDKEDVKTATKQKTDENRMVLPNVLVGALVGAFNRYQI
jgi:hypothetical protein